MRKFGLIGFPLGHSFSPTYFANKFKNEGVINARYDAYPIEEIDLFPLLITEDLIGLNVTIPYKQSVMQYLDSLNEDAREIGAVNTILHQDGRLRGYNTDYYGFQESLKDLLGDATISTALILGTGGSSKAVAYALKRMGIEFTFVSRHSRASIISYAALKEDDMASFQLIINTTPLGMYPKIDSAPDIPYHGLSSQHFCYDLVYNPIKTLFLNKAEMQGAKVKNGHDMLQLQAEKSWQIWNHL